MTKPVERTELQKAVFLDRDGVLNADKGYVFRPADLEVLPGVPEALSELKRRGYLLIVLSNQSGVARGYFDLDDVERFQNALGAAIQQAGGPAFDAVYVCPHHPDGSVATYAVRCACRKPGTELITQAVDRFGIDLGRSYLVGDKPSDVDCALNAGLTPIQVCGTQYASHPQAAAHVASLKEALSFIN